MLDILVDKLEQSCALTGHSFVFINLVNKFVTLTLSQRQSVSQSLKFFGHFTAKGRVY